MSAGTGSACPGTAAQEPPVISNPPGQPAISYRVGDFTGFRRALLRPLPGEQAISGWRPASGDLGLQVLEWWAYVADVLCFYNERYANESYLGTATQPGSIANLAALLGYRPSPGIAATGMLAAVSSAGSSAAPLVLPAGMSVSSTASPGVPSQIFEVDSTVTFTGQSTVPVALQPDPTLQQYADGSPQSVLVAGRVSGVKAGDRLVLVDSNFTGDNDYWSLVTVSDLTPTADPATGVVNTVVGFADGGWGPTPQPAAEEAPVVPVPPQDSTGYRLLRPAAAAAIINPVELAEPHRPPGQEHPIVTSGSGREATVQRVHLSAAVRAISPGDLVLFDLGAGNPSALAVVTATSEALWAVPFPGTRVPRPPDIVVAHTVLDVATADSVVLLDAEAANSLGAIAVRYGLHDVGTIIGVPQPRLTSLGGTVVADYAPPSGGTAAFLQDAAGEGIPVTVLGAGSGNVTIAAAGTPPMAAPASVPLAAPLAVPLQLLLNLVPVSRGKTVTGEVLGSGNAALASQSFKLSKSPLTYLPGHGSTLTVTVNQIEWEEVLSFYGQPASARVFVVTRSPDQASTTVTFGDGVNGARLPSGTGNVVASYRYGSGAASPPAGRLTTIGQPQLNLASIQNPVPVTPGEDPQAPGDVRTAAPASVTTFARAISATDYEQIASQAPGVNRAAASWTFDGAQQRTLVTVYVGDGPAAVTSAETALAATQDPNRQVSVAAASAVELSLSCRLMTAPGQQGSTVIAAATAALSAAAGGLFNPGRMGIGQRLYRSAVDAALLVPGVTAVHHLEVTTAEQVLGEFLDPGPGAYFDLAPDQIDIEAVSADD